MGLGGKHWYLGFTPRTPLAALAELVFDAFVFKRTRFITWFIDGYSVTPYMCLLQGLSSTHRPLSSSFLGSPYRILNISHKKELLRGLWVT